MKHLLVQNVVLSVATRNVTKKVYCITLSDISIILGPHANLFSVIRALQKGLELTSEGETLILKKNQPILVLTINWPTTAVEDFF